MNLHSHTRTLERNIREIWRSPGRFTKNPDIVRLGNGRLLLVYSDNDAHWSQESQILTILASDDNGDTWFKLSSPGMADLRKGDERLVTPRLSRFSDGRLAVFIDHDDYGHFHEDQPHGIWIYWSHDNGLTWSKPQTPEIPGFEPDRIVELPDGRYAAVVQAMRGQSQQLGLVFYTSSDKGKTWQTISTVLHDGYHQHAEGGLIVMDNGKLLAVVARENHNAGNPSFVAFSRDSGLSWTAPQMCPFHFHRPYGKQLADGRVLVTGRNLLGGSGTYAWCGDLKAEAGFYEPGGPLAHYKAGFEDGIFVIENGPNLDARYTLLPPESSKADIFFEAEVKVEGNDKEFAAFFCVAGLARPGLVKIAPDLLGLDGIVNTGVDSTSKLDFRQWRTITLRSRRGLLTVAVDGKIIFRRMESYNAPVAKDSYCPEPGTRTQFGQLGEKGKSFWRRVSYRVINPTQPDCAFEWRAADGRHPDHYQRERLTLLHPNVHPKDRGGWPDHGYSSWLQLDDGTIVFVDYTTAGDKGEEGHLVGGRFRPEDV